MLIKPRTLTTAAAALLLATTASLATAGTSNFIGYVDQVVVTDDDTLGGCAAQFLTESRAIIFWPRGRLPACRGGYMTFRCKQQDGDARPHDPLLAYQMLDQAKLAYAAGKKVKVYFRDDPAYNSTVCTIYRLDLLP